MILGHSWIPAACLFVAAVSAVPGTEFDLALELNDECQQRQPGDSACELSALQRGVSVIKKHGVIDPEFGIGDSSAEPDTRRYSGINVEELGSDELRILLTEAQNVLDLRSAKAVLGSNTHEDMTPAPRNFQDASSSRGTCSNGSPFTGGTRASRCFCQLAQNPGCAAEPCVCPQGCGNDVVWRNAETVTFKNRARAHGCNPSTVLLTSHKSYFSTPAELKKCGKDALRIIETLLRDSWNVYQTHVARASMHQCFHGSQTASVKYLHMQSFCSYASFHAMPNSNPAVGSCVVMEELGQVPSLAKQLLQMMQ